MITVALLIPQPAVAHQDKAAPVSDTQVVQVIASSLSLPNTQFPDRQTQYVQGQETDAQIAAAQAAAAEKAYEEAIASRVKPGGTYPNNYAPGNCTWWVASRIPVPNSMGNANAWGSDLPSHPTPVVGAIAWTTAGWAGHVALVEAVNGDQVEVSEMNWNGLGATDDRWTSVSDWSGFLY